MTPIKIRYVWVYMNWDEEKQIVELSIWQSPHVGAPTLGLPTPNKYNLVRGDARYIVKSEVKLTELKAAQIAAQLYDDEFGLAAPKPKPRGMMNLRLWCLNQNREVSGDENSHS